MKIYTLACLMFCFQAQALFLFDNFKELEGKISYIQLGDLPTPIQRCHNLEKALDFTTIFVKRDDATGSGDLYGGNKVRKLEFLLADAVHKGAKEIITYGCVGTNHGLATACYANKLGLNCLLLLQHQLNSTVVRQNLLLDYYFGARIQLFENNKDRNNARDALLKNNNDSYFFPTGGSVPLGSLGFVNAAFELKEQIKQGIMPEPDFIYLPIGSCGTTAGLLLGLRLANLSTKIVAVAVEPKETVNEFLDMTKELFTLTYQLLASCSSSIPLIDFPDNQLILNKDFCGTEYGQWLRSGEDAARLMEQKEGIILEGTYSAKAAAALFADIKNKVRKEDEVLLLWNTYCGTDFSYLTRHIDYKQLDPAVHRYFEDAQLIDMQEVYPDIMLDLKFATKDNFTGEALYNSYRCLLLKPVAENLAAAAHEFEALGYKVKIWDGYRPPKVSAKLWELMPDDNFIANPKDGGSRHNRGCAVDLTLVDNNGIEVDMGTCFCHFSDKTYRTCQDLPEHVLKNRKLLETIMHKHGFIGLRTEWWHFDYKDWVQYPIIDISL